MSDREACGILAGVGLLIMCIVVVRSCPARADPGQDDSPAVVLARVCTKEAGFDGYADCAAIAPTLLRVGRGNVVRGARLHSRRVFDPAALGNRPWIAFLRGDAEQPAGWPGNVSWRVHRPKWQRMVRLALALLSDGEERPEPPCAPDTWGGPMDRERARRIGYVRIDCGPTRNDFYVNPPRRVRVATPGVAGSARLAAGRFAR